jgi:drug/metabolite transporter (DMT)-like permease
MNQASKKWLAYLCLALGMALVGVYVALSKPLVTALPVFLLAWLRFGIAAVAMLPWLKKPALEAPLTRRAKQLIFLESFFGNFLFSICMLFGVSMTSAVSAGVILATIPAAVAVLSWVFLKEKIGKRVWFAIACAAGGIALLTLSKHGNLSDSGNGSAGGQVDTWLGNALVFGSVLCEAAYVVIGKRLTTSLGPKRISSLINLWGLALTTPIGLYLAWSFNFGAVALNIWLLLVFYALAASVFTVWLWMTGLKTIPAAKAGVFTVMLPISAAAVGVLFLGETLGGVQLLALLIALTGVVMATLPSRAAFTGPPPG